MDAHTSVCISEAKEAYSAYKKSLGDLKMGLYALSPLDRTRLPVLIVHSSCRMDAASVNKVKKWNPSRKDLNAFHIRNPDAFGLQDTSFEVRLDDMDGPIIAIKIKNAFSFDQSLQSLELQELHRDMSCGWNQGCEADPFPTSKSIKSQLQNEKCMKSSGFASTNVKKVIHLGPLSKSGSGCKYGYVNASGKKIYRGISSHIDRHKWAKRGSRSIKHLTDNISIIDIAKKTYMSHIPGYLASRGYGSLEIQENLEEMNQNLELSTLSITQAKPIAIHRDPHTPTFAMLFGHTTHEVKEEEWWDRKVGGTLYLIDGLLELKYSPRDIMIIDGNFAHGVTNVINSDRSYLTERFSVIMFCRWRREKAKYPGKYTGIK